MTEARPRNILVIDSSPQNIGLIEAALPGSPNLFVARNYERAFSVPESAPPDLVILNTTLKDEDGLELAEPSQDRRALRKCPGHSGIARRDRRGGETRAFPRSRGVALHVRTQGPHHRRRGLRLFNGIKTSP